MDNQYNELLKQYNELKAEHELTAKVIIKVCKAVGVLPYKPGDNVLKKILKAIPGITTEGLVYPEKLKERFSFTQELLPLLEKYEKNGLLDKYLKEA